MLDKTRTLLLLGAWLFLPLASWSLPSPPIKGLTFPVTQYTLRNGLEVIIAEDESLPLVSVVIAYRAGALQERPGQMGLAYLVENLMFQGSENISPMQHINYINRIGGELNAITAFDRTIFYQTVSSNQLALALWLESDRMKSLSLTSASVERVKESLVSELRQRRTSNPYMESLFLFEQLLFPDFAYGHPLIGTEEDIKKISEEDVKSFYATYYVPSNAILCLAGRVDVDKARDLVSRYFETIPRGNDIPAAGQQPKLPPRGGVTEALTDSLAPAPAFHLGYRFSPLQTGDYYGLKILDYLLLRGKSCRLYKRLVKKERIAIYLSGGLDERKDRMALKIFAVNNNEMMAERCQKAVLSEITKLKTAYVPEEELSRAKNMFKADYLHRVSTCLEKALFLCDASISGIGPAGLSAEFDKYMKVTPASLIGVINRHFTPERTVILNVQKK